MDPIEQSTPAPAAELLPMVYEELRRLARQRLASEKPGQTLQATALVHEAYLRLTDRGPDIWKSRRYFFAAAAEAMRRILVDRARARQALKRGGDLESISMDEIELAGPIKAEDLVALDAALKEFEKAHPDKAELVKLKFFAGLSTPDLAETFGISEATVKRQWAFARAWLSREISRE